MYYSLTESGSRIIKSDHKIQAIRCAGWASEDQRDLKLYELGMHQLIMYKTSPSIDGLVWAFIVANIQGFCYNTKGNGKEKGFL